MTFKRFIEDNGFGLKYVTKYICQENPDIEIRIERGSIHHDRPTGFTIYYKGVIPANIWGTSSLTLTEAKESVEHHAKRLGWIK